MNIKNIFKEGMGEIKRKSSLFKLKRNLAEKEKTHSEKLTLLGKKAWESKMDIQKYGEINKALTDVEKKIKGIEDQQNALNSKISEFEKKKTEEEENFKKQMESLESQEKKINDELKPGKEKLQNVQKEMDSIQKRLNNIPDEGAKIQKKILEEKGSPETQAQHEKKLASLKEEKEKLTQKLPGLTNTIQSIKKTMAPVEEKARRLQDEIKKAKDQHNTNLKEFEKSALQVKSEIDALEKEKEGFQKSQDQNFMSLGQKLAETKITAKAVASEWKHVKTAEDEVKAVQADIQDLEDKKTAGSKKALWQMGGLILLSLVIIAGVVVGIILIF